MNLTRMDNEKKEERSENQEEPVDDQSEEHGKVGFPDIDPKRFLGCGG